MAEETTRSAPAPRLLAGLATSRETAAQYDRWAAPYRGNPAALQALLRTARILKYLCYLLYPALLAAAFWGVDLGGLLPATAGAAWGSPFLRILLSSTLGFALETAIRAAIDAPRPYERLGIDPLIRKDTKGRSFPSRHVFSIYAIATCWLAVSLPMGLALMAAGVILAWTRVLGGVHTPRDVVAGALLGIALCGLGCFVL